MIQASHAIRLVESFEPAPEEQKSRELILALLELSAAPFSRHQFNPGHITCSAVVLDPERRRVLLMHHHRFRRWLLAGGHVEETDATLAETAGRETTEETTVRVAREIGLVGLDVHGIPARKGKHEPFHLHHDLIFAFEAESDAIATTDEAPQVVWATRDQLPEYNLPPNVARALMRAAFTLV
jgi:8-oxo-dGTP pyrophosphatase MutT (NUDIX family)